MQERQDAMAENNNNNDINRPPADEEQHLNMPE